MPDSPNDSLNASDSRRRRLILVGVVVYWAGWLTMTHWPKLEFPPLSDFRVDKIAHFAGYCVLAMLLSLLVAAFNRGGAVSRFWTNGLVLLVIAVGGILDELTQPYFGRSFEWGDYAADLCGAIAGLVIASLIMRPRAQQHLAS